MHALKVLANSTAVSIKQVVELVSQYQDAYHVQNLLVHYIFLFTALELIKSDIVHEAVVFLTYAI